MRILTRFANPKREPISSKKKAVVPFVKMIYFLEDLCENIDVTIDAIRSKDQNNPQVIMKTFKN